MITLGADDDLSALRACESGSDDHLPASTGYVLLRAVIASRLKTRLTAAGAGPVLITRWGQGWALTTPH